MRTVSTRLVVVVAVLGLVSGCANIQNDTTRTKAEGTGIGVLAGAGVGALIGAAIGGKRGAAIGAGIGGAVGGVGGYAYGNTVAERKLAYANDEDRLNGEIIAVARENQELQEFNRITATQIQDTRKQITYLKNQYSAGKVSQVTLKKKQNELQSMLAENEKRGSHYNNELAALNEYRQAIAQAGNKSDLTKLDNEIKTLKQQIALLDGNNKQMARLASSLVVRR